MVQKSSVIFFCTYAIRECLHAEDDACQTKTYIYMSNEDIYTRLHAIEIAVENNQITCVKEIIAARSVKSMCEKIVKNIFLCLNEKSAKEG